jgi:hydrogenase maturation protease
VSAESQVPPQAASAGATLVVGVGNEMMRDEGVGVAVVRALRSEPLGEEARVLELGTRGFDLIYEMESAARVIVIDAVRAGREPGSVYVFEPEEARSINSRTSSLHGLDLLDVLELAAATGIRPQVMIVGVEPQEVAPGLGLSQRVKRRLGEVVDRVRRLAEGEEAWPHAAPSTEHSDTPGSADDDGGR